MTPESLLGSGPDLCRCVPDGVLGLGALGFEMMYSRATNYPSSALEAIFLFDGKKSIRKSYKKFCRKFRCGRR